MTEEKAIELAEEFTKMDFSNPMGWTGYYDTELNELSLAVKTVLNMLKEKDKEIEFQKDINKTEKDRHKKTEKSLKGQIIKNNKIIEKLEKEAQGYFENMMDKICDNLLKDEIINLMAEKIFQEGIVWDDKEEVKQYFKRKAEKE